MREIKDSFLQYLYLKRSGSEATRKGYDRDISLFIDYLKERNISDFNEVDKLLILDYLSDLKDGKVTGHKLSESSVSRNLSCLRSFFRYLNSNLDYSDNPCAGIKLKSPKKKLPDFLTYAEVEQLLNSFDESKLVDIRNKLIIELLYATGVRVSELVNIKLNDINSNELLIKVTGKGNKERLVPYFDEINNLIIRYINEYRSSYQKTGIEYLLINQKGNQLSTRSVEQIVSMQGVKAGLRNKIYPHVLRHTFATHILDNGANLRVVQELLGHENLSTTTIYTHVGIEKLQDVINKKHPHSDNKE